MVSVVSDTRSVLCSLSLLNFKNIFLIYKICALRGLDISSCYQCVSILKLLAKQGRTIISTIHTPSALIFEMFDKVYALADGYCIYEGPTKELVPFLSEKGLKCPMYHNPADFRKYRIFSFHTGFFALTLISKILCSFTCNICIHEKKILFCSS